MQRILSIANMLYILYFLFGLCQYNRILKVRRRHDIIAEAYPHRLKFGSLSLYFLFLKQVQIPSKINESKGPLLDALGQVSF